MMSLPIDSVLPSIQKALADKHELILEAPPGAGKTTAVPLALLNQPWLGAQKVLMLEPRRLAARNAAQRLAHNLGEPLGQTIGLRTRTDTKVSQTTRIEVVTEGVLVRMLQNDPSLDGYGLVIFDEFHERNLDSDLGLTLLLEARELLRDEAPLKLLLMSATLDRLDLEKLLPDAAQVRSEGRAFPVEVHYSTPWSNSQQLPERVSEAIQQALANETGSLLVFLPGVAEIRKVQTALAGKLDTCCLVTPLYGDLSIEQQQEAIQPASKGHRKIVLTTAIAETSLTIDGVRVVIDAGLSRTAIYDPRTGMSRLHTQRVSKAASIQRAGRAGRTEPGCCYRLWSAEQQDQLAPQAPIEIEHADLSALTLQLHQWGCHDPSDLQWLTPPPKARLEQAEELLTKLNALAQDSSGAKRLTPCGEKMAKLPLHPRLAHMLVVAETLQLVPEAALLASLFSERDPCFGQGSELAKRLHWLRQHRSHPTAKRIIQQAKRLSRTADAHNNISDNALAQLVAAAWPDRIARGDGAGQFQLANGRQATLPATDPLSRSTWLVVCDLGGRADQARDTIWVAQVLDHQLLNSELAHLTRTETTTEWDEQKSRVAAYEHVVIDKLVLARRPIAMTPDLHAQALCQHIRGQGVDVLPWCEKSRALRQRVQFVARQATDWPDWSDAGLLASLDSWLVPFLGSTSRLSSLNMAQILLSALSWPQQQALTEKAPERLTVPSGSSIRIDYSTHPPVLAVKLQEMFGCTETPRINGTALTLHLLSPAGRPLQVTQDLITFWQNGYPEVRKETRGRYPKHPWPEDPVTAIATAKTKRHLNN
ncbi:ATP-dependent helicase HrpB [Neptunomonas sp. XY-337]|uniref:ATP-dependent helicase HrpB n=1 Tax=Neptunomonas sp. XY-337 TaxID=2561897 RepID=UPI0010AA36AC|nr:ATP-dependent helicase HrpB [Neptunomonas sp. XY-337]